MHASEILAAYADAIRSSKAYELAVKRPLKLDVATDRTEATQMGKGSGERLAKGVGCLVCVPPHHLSYIL